MDRRVRRSEDLELAMKYQLEACSERGDIEALVVADPDGLLLASISRSPLDTELIAALLPEIAYCNDPDAVTERCSIDPSSMLVRAFTVGQSTLFLGVLGRRDGKTLNEMTTATRGLRRILS